VQGARGRPEHGEAGDAAAIAARRDHADADAAVVPRRLVLRDQSERGVEQRGENTHCRLLRRWWTGEKRKETTNSGLSVIPGSKMAGPLLSCFGAYARQYWSWFMVNTCVE